MENELQSARSHLRTCQQAHNRHGRESQGLKVSMQKMEDHVETLREALEKENATEDGRVDALRAAFKEAEEDKEVQEGSYHDSVQAMNDMVQSLKEIRRELAAKDQSITELVERSHVASSEQSLVAGKRRELFNDKNIAVADIERQKDKRDEIQESLELAEARVVQWCGKAEQVSPRVAIDEGETTLSLDHKLSKLNRDLDRYAQQYVLCYTLLLLCDFDFVLTSSRLGGSRDEIAAEAGRAETAYVRAKDQVEELSTVSQVSSLFSTLKLPFRNATPLTTSSSSRLPSTIVRNDGRFSERTFPLAPKHSSHTFSVREVSVVSSLLTTPTRS